MKRKWPVKTIPQCSRLLDRVAVKWDSVFTCQAGEHPRMYSTKTLLDVSNNVSYAAFVFPLSFRRICTEK